MSYFVAGWGGGAPREDSGPEDVVTVLCGTLVYRPHGVLVPRQVHTSNAEMLTLQTAIPFLVGTKFDTFSTFPRDEQEEITKQVRGYS